MMKPQKIIIIVAMSVLVLVMTTVSAVCEHTAWDCPECGRTGNTGNFCGGCGHPAPVNGGRSSERAEKTSLLVGDTIAFGTYPQTEDGTDQTSIDWIVLEIQDGKALLLSKNGLDAMPYNQESQEITWENCTLRSWLNNDFLKKAFNSKQQSAILITDVDNSIDQGYSGWNTFGGNNTKDQIFLLSCAEANKYLNVTYDDYSNIKSRVSPTAYAEVQGAFTESPRKTGDNYAAGWWWLRSPGTSQDWAARVYTDGSLNNWFINSKNGIVRPALWINLESDIF